MLKVILKILPEQPSFASPKMAVLACGAYIPAFGMGANRKRAARIVPHGGCLQCTPELVQRAEQRTDAMLADLADAVT